MPNSRKALKQFIIENLIAEYGDEFGDVDLGGWNDLVKVLGSPNTVLKTAMGSTANVSNKARTLMATVVRGFPSIIIPFIRTKYEKIYSAEERRHREIARMYPEIFTIAREGFPADGQFFAFMLNPIVMTAASVARLGVDLTLDLVDALSGQSPDVITKTRPLRRRVGARHESVKRNLTEDSDQGLKRKVWNLLQDKNFQNELRRAKPVQDIKQRARDIKNETLNNIIQLGRDISSARSLKDLQQLGIDLTSRAGSSNDEQQSEQQIVKAAKEYAIEAIIERLKVQLDEFENLEIPEIGDIHRVYEKTIKRLRELVATR